MLEPAMEASCALSFFSGCDEADAEAAGEAVEPDVFSLVRGLMSGAPGVPLPLRMLTAGRMMP
ncbi:hypothetical protein ADK82_06835 [Streptomyces sp. NRRL S-4]|nr:hypothetical protein ADK82_06835 [Streptomyces sp. NRRL S-4]